MVQPGVESGFNSVSLPTAQTQSLYRLRSYAMEPKLHRPSSQSGFSFKAFLYRSTAFSIWWASRAVVASVESVEKEGAGA
jgi:hypothetical protein